MSSTLRPECVSSAPGTWAPTRVDALLATYHAVKHQDGLIAGALHKHGAHCAVGSYWHEHPTTALPQGFVDEVALVNDSIQGTPKYRRREMLRWLRWKLTQAGVPLPGRPSNVPRVK